MNRMIVSILTAVAITLVFGYSIVLAQEQESKIDKKDCPAAVITAFEKAYPNAKISEIEKSENNGQIMYEIGAKTGKSEIEAGYAADGTLLQVTEDIAVKALPAAVKTAILADMPKGTIKGVEKITKGAAVEYEVMVLVGKEKTEVVADATGKIISKKEEEGKEEEHEKKGEKEKDKD